MNNLWSETRREPAPQGYPERGVEDSSSNTVSIPPDRLPRPGHGRLKGRGALLDLYRSLDKAVSTLEMEMAVERARSGGVASGRSPPQKAFVVVGINTAFTSRKRRDSLRDTWVPRGT